MFKLASLSLLLVLPACPLLEVDVEISEVCMTYRDVRVDPGQPGTLRESFLFDDLSAVQELLELDADLAISRIELRATSGVSDLGFVSRAHVSIASGDPGSTLPTLDVVSCDGDCLPDGSTLSIPAAIQHDAVEYARSGALVVDLDVEGALPEISWTMDVDVCLTGNIRYTFEP